MKGKSVVTTTILLVLFLLLPGCESAMTPAQGDRLLAAADYEQALALYQDHLRKNSANAVLLDKMGYACLKLGRFDEAVGHFKKALAIDPYHTDSVLYLGLTYLRQRNYPAALETWRDYQNKEAPQSADEVRRLETMIRLVQARHDAEKALGSEKDIRTASLPADSIAVSHFRDLSGSDDLKAFSQGLAEMVRIELAKIRPLRVLDRLHLLALLTEMDSGRNGLLASTDAQRIGRLLGVENIVVGALNKGIAVNAELVNVKNSSVIETTSTINPPESFFELPGIIVGDVANSLGRPLSRRQVFAVSQPQTVSYKAVVLYGKGLQEFDMGNWKEARHYFELALQEDNSFLPAKEAFASCPGSDYPRILNISHAEMERMDLGAFAEQMIDRAMGDTVK